VFLARHCDERFHERLAALEFLGSKFFRDEARLLDRQLAAGGPD